MDAISIGAAGLISAGQRFDAAAQTTVAGGDLVAGVADTTSAKTDFEASAKVLKVANQMVGSLLDMVA